MKIIKMLSGKYAVCQLPEISKLAFKTFPGNQYWVDHGLLLEEGKVIIDLEDGVEPEEASAAQHAAVAYTLSNERIILKNILQIIVDNYPSWKDELGSGDPEVDEEWFPEIDSIDDLSKALVIAGIEIYRKEKNGLSYMQYNFISSWEEEHGFAVIMNGEEVVGHGATDIDLREFFTE